MDLEQLLFTRANIENVGELLDISHRCMNEVNYKDYAPHEFEKYLANFTEDWLIDIINTRHYYEVWYQGKIIACGGISKDYSQEKQSYFTAIFVNPDYRGSRSVLVSEYDGQTYHPKYRKDLVHSEI